MALTVKYANNSFLCFFNFANYNLKNFVHSTSQITFPQLTMFGFHYPIKQFLCNILRLNPKICGILNTLTDSLKRQ